MKLSMKLKDTNRVNCIVDVYQNPILMFSQIDRGGVDYAFSLHEKNFGFKHSTPIAIVTKMLEL